VIRLAIQGLRLVSEANAHEHYRVRVARVREQHRVVSLVIGARRAPPLPLAVTIVRVAPHALDTDNLQGSGKHVRDALAKWIGVDDRDPRVVWHVGAEKGAYATRIVVRHVGPATVCAVVRGEAEGHRVRLQLTPAQRAALARALTQHTAPVTLSLDGLHLEIATVTATQTGSPSP